ncbi:1-acyl-sn-glycerol-3-phosphate acyltransferase [Roseomonas sp. HJA6]|uniref:1-acyl-sn-glycerol-3-phosphate acyltransferase n=1 Tax=Roseomonas alba TaxID=2846776 RepID=A0ABS7A6R0_9PROT|nr:lysophospholipid acyltransferase family protein [Neoroseomonas alba]MBW6397987.1 1-acyl-sn-glycerol-3-phosphate acyltransferase [Neoroseomonas alba]
MTMLRSALFNLLFLGGTALVVLAAVPLLAAPPPVLIGYVRLWARAVIGLLRIVCGIRVAVTGLEHIPTGGAIIAAKHQSAFDTVVWLVLLPRCVYVLKKELLDIPIWGWLARRCGHVAVDRKAGAKALRGMVREAGGRLAEGRPIVIFPEGTRTAPGEHVPYQPGVAALAAATHAPVVPVATDSGRCWGRRAFRKPPGVIHISVLPPLPAGQPRAALMNALETAIEDETARLHGSAHPVDKSGERGCG